MPDYDRTVAQQPEKVDPPTRAAQERVALLAASQLDKGATAGQVADTLAMLGLDDAATALAARRTS